MPSANMSISARKEQARLLLQGNRLAEAKTLYKEICRNARRDWEAWQMLGAIHGMLGEFAEAETCSRRAIELHPDAIGALLNLGNALMAQHKYEEATRCYRRILARNAREPQAHNNLGTLLKLQGRLEEAEASYREALRHAPHYPDALTNLGTVLQEQGRLEEALACYQRAVQLKPDHADALHNLGCGLIARGEFTPAVACYEHLLRIQPTNVRSWIALSSIHRQLRQFDKALACGERATVLEPQTADSYLNLGVTYQAMGEHSRAVAMYREALRYKPDFVDAHYFLATLGAEAAPTQSPVEYVTKLFDDYAERFDAHLTGELECRIPEYINAAVRRALGGSPPLLDVIDLGCGTGLLGRQLHDLARSLVGVDLSPKMIAKARTLGVYDELIVGDVLTPLSGTGTRYGLIAAADVFVYLGDLAPIFAGCRTALQPEGLFAFSVEALDASETFALRPSGRYAHATEYIHRLAKGAGLEEVSRERVTLRKEAGNPIAGDIYVFRLS